MQLTALTQQGSLYRPAPKYAVLRLFGVGFLGQGSGSFAEEAADMEVQLEATYRKLIIEQGSQFDQPFKWYDSDGVSTIDLTNKAVEFVITQSKGDSAPIYKIGSPVNVTKDAVGAIEVIIAADITDGFSFGRGFYELAVSNYDGSAIVVGGSYTEADIDVDYGAGYALITADGGTPFSALATGDMIQVSGLTDDDNEGVYEIHTVTDTVITTTLTMNGVDTLAETSISIQPLSEGTRKRLAEGPIVLTKEA